MMNLFAQAPDTLWTKSYGVPYESGYDEGKSVLQTPDGGYIILANTDCYGAGSRDIWLIRTDSSGDTIWTKTYGGAGYDCSNSFQKTSDGGLIITGSTDSYGAGAEDVWLIKTNGFGDIVWAKTYGGMQGESGSEVKQTSDDGYIIVGTTNSFGAGGSDVWLIKTDASGDTLWTRTFGGSEDDEGRAVEITWDVSYIIAGNTHSFGAGENDIWLIKVDSAGSALWTKTYGKSDYEYCNDVLETTDSCYVILGNTGSDIFHCDIWLIKTDTSGDTLWTKAYNRKPVDRSYELQQTSDEGYIISGVTGFGLSGDFLLIKTDFLGDTLWTKTYVTTGLSFPPWWICRPVRETADGGYIIATVKSRYTRSDVCLIKTDANGDSLWTQTYGGLGRTGWDSGNHVEQTSDGGYILVGYKSTYGNYTCGIWLIKTDEFGDTLWTKTFGGDARDEGMVVRETLDGGYIIVGTKGSEGGDIWVIKTDNMGDSLWSRTYSGVENGKGVDVQETSSGDYTILGNIAGQAWLIKTNSIGDTIWTNSYSGGSANALEKTSDGGYAITGGSGMHVWLVKADSTGDTLWTKTYVGGWGNSLQQTLDGGFIITGESGGLLLIKTDAFGDTVWVTRYDYGAYATEGNSVKQTIDGGFIITGYVSHDPGYNHFLLLRTDATGDILWTKTFGDFFETGNSIQITSDHGYIITGTYYSAYTYSQDVLLMKTAPDPITYLKDNKEVIPHKYVLYQNYPNPFNPTTVISWRLAVGSPVKLTVYNIQGQKVASLINQRLAAGLHSVEWDASNMASGIYFYKLETGSLTQTKKMMLIR
jgi:hypothetical protein